MNHANNFDNHCMYVNKGSWYVKDKRKEWKYVNLLFDKHQNEYQLQSLTILDIEQ